MHMHLRLLAAVLVTAMVIPATASASWLQPHTRQEAIPQAEIERPLVVGKSWLEADLDFSWKHSDSHWLGDATVNPGMVHNENWEFERNRATWDYRRATIGLRWGFSRHIEINLRVPVVWAQVWNNQMMMDKVEDDPDTGGTRIVMETDPLTGDLVPVQVPNPITSVGLGDVHTGLRVQALRLQSKDGRISNSLVIGLDMRLPSGSESPGTYIGGPNNIVTIVTGAGTWGFDLYARYRQHLAFFGFDVGIGYVLNPANTVMYLVDTETQYFSRALDPGDVVHGDIKFTVQPAKQIAIQAGFDLDYRTVTKWGHTVETLPYCRDCPEVPNSEGLYVDFIARLLLDPTPHLGIDIYLEATMAGRRNFLWPLEEISPSRGWTLGGNLSYRF